MGKEARNNTETEVIGEKQVKNDWKIALGEERGREMRQTGRQRELGGRRRGCMDKTDTWRQGSIHRGWDDSRGA